MFSTSMPLKAALSHFPRSNSTCSTPIFVKSSKKTLRHLHFKNIIDYEKGSEIQEQFVRANLDFKKINSKILKRLSDIKSGNVEVEIDGEKGIAQVSEYEQSLLQNMVDDMKPNPILLTFQFHPVYSGGKREKHSQSEYNFKDAHYVQSSRGGQVTYHGPGQMVGYSIIDLADFSNDRSKKTLSPRCFVNGLEQAIIDTLFKGDPMAGEPRAQQYQQIDIPAIRTGNTGVWINEHEKIASIGVHIRRGITCHGVAINGSTDLDYPNHFVMCGVDNSTTTSIAKYWQDHNYNKQLSLKGLSYSYAKQFAKIFGFAQVEHFDIDQLDSPPEKGFKEDV